jgi:hypothetical protein
MCVAKIAVLEVDMVAVIDGQGGQADGRTGTLTA